MANIFLTLFDEANGESTQRGKEKWIEVLAWDWEVEAESSLAMGGGAAVGKPTPGAMSWEHAFDTSSTVILAHLCTGAAFSKAQLQVTRPSSRAVAEAYFIVTMDDILITRVGNASSDGEAVRQRVEMVFRTVKIEYRSQAATGKLGPPSSFTWDIADGRVTT